nr:hypothetical protein [Chitinivorax sp. B]
MGFVAAGGCDYATIGGCAPANPAIVAGGVALGAGVGAAAGNAMHSAGEQLDKAWNQLERLVNKANTSTSPSETQYALVARVAGAFPDVRNGVAYLNAGDIWKYGTTSDPAGRYSATALNALGLRMLVQSTGTHYEVLAQEKLRLIEYFIANGTLPPGNRIFK